MFRKSGKNDTIAKEKMEMENSTLYRVVTIGDSAVGKTSLINCLMGSEFNPNEQSTVGAMFILHVEEYAGKRMELQVWDTAGQEKFRSLGPIYYRNADVAVVVFDMTNSLTYDNLDSWISSFIETAGTDSLIVIAANKCDLAEQRNVEHSTVQRWSFEKGYLFFETSAVTGYGVKEMFAKIGEELYNRKSRRVAEAVPMKQAEIEREDKTCKC